LAGVQKAKTDRTSGRFEEQALRSVGKKKEDRDKWEYASDDDDLVVVQTSEIEIEEPLKQQKGGKRQRTRRPAKRRVDEFIIGNVADTAILKAASKTRKTPLTDIDLMEKTPRARVALDVEVGSVYLRKFVETTAEGEVMAGYQNSRYRSKAQAAQTYWKLPQEGGQPGALRARGATGERGPGRGFRRPAGVYLPLPSLLALIAATSRRARTPRTVLRAYLQFCSPCVDA